MTGILYSIAVVSGNDCLSLLVKHANGYVLGGLLVFTWMRIEPAIFASNSHPAPTDSSQYPYPRPGIVFVRFAWPSTITGHYYVTQETNVVT